MAHADTAHAHYYVPDSSRWPVLASLAIFVCFVGGALTLNHASIGPTVLGAGFLTLFIVLFGWFGDVIRESERGRYTHWEDMSFRMGMMWFIFSEVMFFAAFFGALFYARVYSVPWLGGAGHAGATHEFLWPNFLSDWPLLKLPADYGFAAAKDVIPAWGVPAINTAILVSSGVTVTWAHWGLKANKRGQLILGLALTVALGALFVFLQAEEYGHAYHELGLTLNAGIYGATFFLLTGFHGFHVSMGTLMLFVILLRAIKGHFKPDHHFAFEAVAWYWHFVDVVWIGLFIFVYWL
ncbi:MAG: cytochrome c oxidase subunit 3 [Gammaproteobacteria bacterium]|nr:cytochrome c oxidase subunit 3 [Gammaproteobacteria bacterium]